MAAWVEKLLERLPKCQLCFMSQSVVLVSQETQQRVDSMVAEVPDRDPMLKAPEVVPAISEQDLVLNHE